MSFGNILGQILNDGLAGRSRSRVDASVRNLGARGGSAVDGIFGQLQGALGQARAPEGFADAARDFMTKGQVGGMSGAQLGGIGAVAGALLGGGVGGAARGGALAVLGTLALTALRNAQAGQGAAAAAEPEAIDAREVAALTGPDAEKLLVQAMISAAKADGSIDPAEMQKIIGRIDEGGVSEAERSFVMAELAAPVDIPALAAQVQGQAQAAEVYAASLIAIDVDSDAERAYLRALAEALGLDQATVAQLHEMTGAPAA
jgi:uncharacterized membrane protein YebE (DUF533 family)